MRWNDWRHLGDDLDRRHLSGIFADDTKFLSGKMAAFQYFVVAAFIFLIASFWDLQVRNPELYSEAALRNRIKSIPMLAPRGKILDRDGRVIVDNHPTYSALLNLELYDPKHVEAIAAGLNLDYEETAAKLARLAARPRFRPAILKQELSAAELAFVDSHRDNSTFPELELIHVDRRLYPHDGVAAHVIGYVGEVSEAELDAPEFASYSQGDIVGKAGIERQYNDLLMGIDGQRQEIVDYLGRPRGGRTLKEAVPGQTIQLTLDLDLQAVAELAMEGKRGAVVALDPRTGEVLAMVSRPVYDPNLFNGRIRTADWKAIVDDPHHPLLNRAIQAQQAPGSTFKPIMALAGLETGFIDENTHVNCTGGATFYGNYHGCHLKSGHGSLALTRALAQSCDVYFYNLGNRMGIDRISQFADLAGLGRRTGIDLPHEAEGILPSNRWKIRTLRQKWYPGDTISVSIGQGYTTVTPLQLAAAIGGLANGGHWMKPHLMKSTNPEIAREGKFSPGNIARVVTGMWSVVNDGGTAQHSALPGIELCGKTGTAQLASNAFLKAKKGVTSELLKDNAWFVGFAPRQNPEIVVAALYENGVEGPWAAPIARDVVKAYFDKKARLSNLKSAQSVAGRGKLFENPAAGPSDLREPAANGVSKP